MMGAQEVVRSSPTSRPFQQLFSASAKLHQSEKSAFSIIS